MDHPAPPDHSVTGVVSRLRHVKDLPVLPVGGRLAGSISAICLPARNGSAASGKAPSSRYSPRSLATASGTLCAIGLWRISSRFGEAVRAFLLLPLMVPPIISAMAFYRWWIPLGLIDSYLGIIIAHAILALPLVLITVSASLANFDPRLEQASRSLGASMSTTVWRVILPVIKPGIAAGAVFAFILSWDEIVVTLFISKFAVFTLPRRLWNGMRENTDPTVAAAAVVLILITLAALAIFALTSRRRGDDTA